MTDKQKTKQELIQELDILRQRVAVLDKSELARKRAEKLLQGKTHELGERVKELNCLYTFSKLIERPDISLPEIFEGLVNIIPPGWQYPEVTCARLVFEDQILKTPNFNETIWKQSSPILVDRKSVGTLEVYYLEEKPECDEGPFLKRERDLIDALAARLGKTIQRKRAEGALQESEEHFRSVAQSASDAIITIDSAGSIVFWNSAAETLFGYSPNEVINKPIAFIMPERFREVHQKRLSQVALGGESKIIGKMVEVLGLRKDGSEFPIEVSLATWKTKESMFFTGVVRDITERKWAEAEREKLILELKEALSKVKQLSGMLPICASCKKIRDDKGYWKQIESYIGDHSEAEFTHGICPECVKKLYPDIIDEEK